MIIQILDRIIYRYIIFFKVAGFVFNKHTKLSKIVRFLTGVIAMFVMSSHRHGEKTSPEFTMLQLNRKDETLSIHETKINRLQVGVRKNEYDSDALDQYSRRENVRITGIPEGEGTEENFILSVSS
jgi:hypothetical protein